MLAALIIGLIVALGGGDDEPEPEALTPDEKWERDCFSAWDGSHRNFGEAVKAKLKSPSSFKHEETRFSSGDFPRDDPHGIRRRQRILARRSGARP